MFSITDLTANKADTFEPTKPGEEGLKLVPDSSKIEGNFKKNSKAKVRVLNCTNHGYH